jgi:hypothetical protein
MPSRVMGWGGTLSIEGTSVPIRSLSITRQAEEVDVTSHSDARKFSVPGRVKRGGTFEAYVGDSQGTVVSAMESINLANPASIVWSGPPALSMEVTITSCELAYAMDDAAVYTVSFVETVVIS